MKIAVLMASHRTTGKNLEIENAIIKSNFNHEFDFIKLAEKNITPTLTDFANDDFDDILARMINSDVILLIVPAYCPYPAKFVALMERLLDVSYLVENKPLENKFIGIFYYCSVKILDETPIKLLFQKYLMNNYSFDEINYDKFANAEATPNEKYHNNITEYVLDVIKKL